MKKHKDSAFYRVAGEELASGNFNTGLFTKAYSHALGDQDKTRALYIKYRVEQLVADAKNAIRKPIEPISVAKKRRLAEQHVNYMSDLQKRFILLKQLELTDTDHIPSSDFDGDISYLNSPVPVEDVSEAFEIHYFKIIDAIKLGHFSGVRLDGNWWIANKV